MLLRENYTAEHISKLREKTGIKKISSIRNVNPLAYAYMIKSLQLLKEEGLYTDSIF